MNRKQGRTIMQYAGVLYLSLGTLDGFLYNRDMASFEC
jgi:hypothetical protein